MGDKLKRGWADEKALPLKDMGPLGEEMAKRFGELQKRDLSPFVQNKMRQWLRTFELATIHDEEDRLP